MKTGSRKRQLTRNSSGAERSQSGNSQIAIGRQPFPVRCILRLLRRKSGSSDAGPTNGAEALHGRNSTWLGHLEMFCRRFVVAEEVPDSTRALNETRQPESVHAAGTQTQHRDEASRACQQALARPPKRLNNRF